MSIVKCSITDFLLTRQTKDEMYLKINEEFVARECWMSLRTRGWKVLTVLTFIQGEHH